VHTKLEIRSGSSSIIGRGHLELGSPGLSLVLQKISAAYKADM
jgi:hypothetical protein